jgi:hypothetical protein
VGIKLKGKFNKLKDGFKRVGKRLGGLGGVPSLKSHLLYLFWSIITKFTFSHVLGLAIKIVVFLKNS